MEMQIQTDSHAKEVEWLRNQVNKLEESALERSTQIDILNSEINELTQSKELLESRFVGQANKINEMTEQLKEKMLQIRDLRA